MLKGSLSARCRAAYLSRSENEQQRARKNPAKGKESNVYLYVQLANAARAWDMFNLACTGSRLPQWARPRASEEPSLHHRLSLGLSLLM